MVSLAIRNAYSASVSVGPAHESFGWEELGGTVRESRNPKECFDDFSPSLA